MKKINFKVSTDFFGEEKNDWKDEWKNMPEFISEDKRPIQQIIVSFKTYEDVKEFGRRLNINVTSKTGSTWFPARAIDRGTVYVNEFWGTDEE